MYRHFKLIALLLMVSLVGVGCSFTDNILIDANNPIKIERDNSFTSNVTTEKSLTVNFPIADLEVIPTDDEFISFNLKYILKGKDKEKMESFLNDLTFDLSTSTEDEVIANLKHGNIDSSNLKHFSSFMSKMKNSNLEIEGTIEFPRSMSNINVNMDVGDVDFKDLNSSINANISVGDVDLDKCRLTGSSNIKTDVGEISADILSMEADSDLKLTTNVGEIDMELIEKSGPAKVEITSNVGECDLTVSKINSYVIDYKGKKIENLLDEAIINFSISTDVGEINIVEN